MTRGYDEIYLEDAMETLGSAVEYAVLVAGIDGQEFINLFLASGLAEEFGRGSVKYISGMSGIEFSRLILTKCGMSLPAKIELSHIDYPAEYWIGWILAYYQWYTGKDFNVICNKITYADLFNLYGVLHEADQSKAIEVFDSMMQKSGETNLAIHRKNKGLSQSELAKAAGISIRSIQLYEQRKTDINNAQFNHLKALSDVLGCEIKDILE